MFIFVVNVCVYVFIGILSMHVKMHLVGSAYICMFGGLHRFVNARGRHQMHCSIPFHFIP